jgi:hypothetical protein
MRCWVVSTALSGINVQQRQILPFRVCLARTPPSALWYVPTSSIDVNVVILSSVVSRVGGAVFSLVGSVRSDFSVRILRKTLCHVTPARIPLVDKRTAPFAPLVMRCVSRRLALKTCDSRLTCVLLVIHTVPGQIIVPLAVCRWVLVTRWRPVLQLLCGWVLLSAW